MMKALLSALIVLATFSASGQDKITQLQANKILLNGNGENLETNTVQPVKVTINYENKTVTIQTTSQDITQLFKGQMVRKLQNQMGALGVKYSLQLDDNIMMHVHNDTRIILFTRSDIHPLQWGLQLQEFEKVE